ncbi:MAG: threonine--tRNA ligase [Gammaproteobacteria bacterium]|nr:threonine--tRNA ligase [Gammaproteobacteria bacterium]
MPVLTLPDGSHRKFDSPVTVAELAADIGPGLARAAIAGRVDGKLVDTTFGINDDAAVAIITAKDEEGVEILRHSTAHLLAHAVKELFPSAQITIGPVIEDGFFYDFSFERPFTPEDLEKIEAQMKKLAKADLAVEREVMDRAKAIAYFRGQGEHYKSEIIEAIPDDEEIGLYGQGGWKDLCRGPHVPTTGKLKAFKLTKLAGAYWRGDSNNEMLQRIYGTAWPDQDSLKAYLTRLEEAEKRDHRRFGKVQDLFHTQPEAPGMVFWHDKGWRLYRTIQDYLRGRLEEQGYQEVHTPQMLDRSLWEKSGHWDKYADNMFTTGSEDRLYAIKPMNCPCHVQIYNQHLHSYRDLPVRMAEFGSCHRNEASGTLHGLMRVRNFTQDDAHIFCTEDQIQSEVAGFVRLLLSVYEDFGFNDVPVTLSTRPENRVGEDSLWDKAEQALMQALRQTGLEHTIEEGEGAFYGPKIDFSMRDSIGRVWQLGTIQLDFSMPARLGATYVAEDSSRRVPVMLHRAILGSLERFIGVLIEHFAGSLPPWLAPVQAVVLNITDRQSAYAAELAESLKKQGFQVGIDLRNEKIGFKIREHSIQRVPYLLVVGHLEEEDADQNVAVRSRDHGDLGVMSIDKFARRLREDCARRGRISLEE